MISDFKLEEGQFESVQNLNLLNSPAYMLYLAQCFGYNRCSENICKIVVEILSKYNYMTPQNGEFILKYKYYNQDPNINYELVQISINKV